MEQSSTRSESPLTPDSFEHEGTELTEPADAPLGVEDEGVTLRHQRLGDSLEERVWREDPEGTADDPHDSAMVSPEEAAMHITEEP